MAGRTPRIKLAVLADRVQRRATMSEQHLVHTVSTLDAHKTNVPFDELLRRIAVSLLVMLILATVWYGATELLVLAFKDAWSFGPRYF
jgi:hypothetical protein